MACESWSCSSQPWLVSDSMRNKALGKRRAKFYWSWCASVPLTWDLSKTFGSWVEWKRLYFRRYILLIAGTKMTTNGGSNAASFFKNQRCNNYTAYFIMSSATRNAFWTIPRSKNDHKHHRRRTTNGFWKCRTPLYVQSWWSICKEEILNQTARTSHWHFHNFRICQTLNICFTVFSFKLIFASQFCRNRSSGILHWFMGALLAMVM